MVGGSLFTATGVSAAPVVVPFAFTGGEQQFVVPAGVTSIHVVLNAGSGGGGAGGLAGGVGMKMSGDLPVTPGTTLYVEVGGNGAAGNAQGTGGSGGFNGGASGGAGQPNSAGGGGGASDIRNQPRAVPMSAFGRMMVAGGGGGAGGGTTFGAGAPGASDAEGDPNGGSGGGGGQESTGGVGGLAKPGDSPGTSGTFALGGIGGAGVRSGGGGGGGWYGGGGGGGSTAGDGGGGGGGSNHWIATVTNILITFGDPTPFIEISYESSGGGGGPTDGTVDAQVSVEAAAACIQLTPAAVDFGTLPLGAANAPASPPIVVTNCSTSDETILASGSDATGTNASWTLVDTSNTCANSTLELDNYRLALAQAIGPTVSLAHAEKAVTSLAGAGSTNLVAQVHTACPGSTGAGQVMSMQINFLATVP
ncbi:MAG TPA: hypothetical protein VFW27_04540 [Actinoplanes sp.]|nr:hypothetical protein [Actinoplanes sp.]